MSLITDSAAVAAFCDRQKGAQFVAIDTEFMRERTYWPILCVVQVAGPEEAVAIDALAEDIDLKPLLTLMADARTLKVFHAARQDLEIFFQLSGEVPHPIFDTQVAAMVCGFGDAASYETLVKRLAGASLDKASRFTDWAHRPLTDRQLEYALADVVHLRTVYDRLQHLLAENGRAGWCDGRMADLIAPAISRSEPAEAWRRFRIRSRADQRFLGVLRALAAWREKAAQQRDLPRGRIMRDEAVLEIAAHAPKTIATLGRTRRRGKARAESPPGIGPLIELLRVLLKQRCEDFQVAQKLVASADDLVAIAADDEAPVRALSGWRRDVFGNDALALKHGRLALTAGQNRIEVAQLRQ